MKAIVTGGAGFIGSHLTEALGDLGTEVLVIDNLSSGKRENIPASADLAEVDITTPECEQVINDFAPNAVFHLAAQMDVRRSVADPVFDARTNVEGTVRVANAAAHAGAKAIFFSSTGGAIYGEQETFPADEEHPTRAQSPYGVAKKCGELYLDLFSRTSSMRSVMLRLGNIYGPRQDPHGEAGVVAIFSRLLLEGESPTINGDGGQTRDYVFVDDVVRAFLLALRHTDVQGPINIGTGIETDVNALASMMSAAAGFTGEVKYGPAKPGEQRRSVLNNQRAAQLLHWQPQIAIADGLATTVEWFKNN